MIVDIKKIIMSLAFLSAVCLSAGVAAELQAGDSGVEATGPAQGGATKTAHPGAAGGGSPETPGPAPEKPLYTGKKMSIEVQNADIHRVLKMIGEVSGKNVVVSEAVRGKVTVKLLDMPWDQALDMVLASRNLGVEESGNVLLIYDLPTLNRLRADQERLDIDQAIIDAPLHFSENP